LAIAALPSREDGPNHSDILYDANLPDEQPEELLLAVGVQGAEPGAHLRLEVGEPPVAVVASAAAVEAGTGTADQPAVGGVAEALPKGYGAERHPPQAEGPSRLDGGHDAEVHGAVGCVGPPPVEVEGDPGFAHPDP
jgi:hypothetical protein